MECLVDTPNNTKLSLCQTSVWVFGWCLFAVDSSSSLDRRRFFYFFRMMKKTNTRREGTLKTWEKNISKVTRKKRRHSKNRHKKNDGRPFRESPRFGSIDRSIDRLLPPPSTEYTAIDKSPNLGIFFFLTRPCENARGVRVERATVVLWCLFSK